MHAQSVKNKLSYARVLARSRERKDLGGCPLGVVNCNFSDELSCCKTGVCAAESIVLPSAFRLSKAIE